MELSCIWEHNGDDSLLYCADFPGAYTRGGSLEEALIKMPAEVCAYCAWAGIPLEPPLVPVVIFEKDSDLTVRDADSDVLFPGERLPLTEPSYRALKALARKSAKDFQTLYDALPDKNITALPSRETFYGPVPITGESMYQHTKNVNSYYFGEIGVDTDNEGTIVQCRERGFQLLEAQEAFLSKGVFPGSYGEEWSLGKVLRRFLWHDRIHAKAMYRMAVKTFGADSVPDIFSFERSAAL